MESGTCEAPLSSSSEDTITTADTESVMASMLPVGKRTRLSLRIMAAKAKASSPAKKRKIDVEDSVPARAETSSNVEDSAEAKNDSENQLDAAEEQITTKPSAGAASKVSVTAEKTKEKMASNPVSDVSAEDDEFEEASKKWIPVDDYHLDPVTSLTVGDTVEKYLKIQNLRLFHHQHSSLRAVPRVRLMLISQLPCYPDVCYTEEEVASVLYPFGFIYAVDTIYVIPQTGMALVLMPSSEALKNVVRKAWDGIPFKGSTICLRPVSNGIKMSPVQFYQSLMKLMHFKVTDRGTRTVFFHDVSPSEVEELRKVFFKNLSVRNFLPLLNKLYVEFESIDDVSLLRRSYSHYRVQNGTMMRFKKQLTLNSLNDSLTAEKAKEKMASNSVSDVSAESAQEAASSSTKTKSVDYYRLDPVTSLTVGDTVEKYLKAQNLHLYHQMRRSSFYAKHNLHLLLISQLPCFPNDCYTEEEVASLLYPFGFRYAVDTIYVIPQTGMALVLMPSPAAVENVVREAWDGIPFKGRLLHLRPVSNKISMSPFGFYKSLMKLMHFNVTDNGIRTVFFHDVSPSEVGELRKVLIKKFPVRNFLPLLNKLYVEFESSDDVDLLGLLYSQYQAQTYTMLRLEKPRALSKSYAHYTLPQKTFPPFWVTMKTAPYIFPIARPCFNIPPYTTTTVILKTNLQDTWFSGVMLTGLPKFAYQHQTVVDLVWQHVPEENYDSLSSNVIVLPLQRRAFVFFSYQFSALHFLKMNDSGSITFKNLQVGIHPLIEMTHPGPSAVKVYTDMMKWSNCVVYNYDTLDRRLLYVQTFQASLNLVTWFMKVVSSIAPFVNFLPLGDRIYVEMRDTRALIYVVGQLSSAKDVFPNENWKNIGFIGPLLNQSDLEVLVKTLTPVILAEINKMSSTSSSSSSHHAGELKAATVTPEREPGLQKSKESPDML